MQRNQVTGQQLLVTGSQQRQSNPLSPKHKETAFQYPPNGYYQKNKIEIQHQVIANSKLLSNLVNGVAKVPTAEISKFEQELLARNQDDFKF